MGPLLALLLTVTRQLSWTAPVGVTHTSMGVLAPGATVCAVAVVSTLKGTLPHPVMLLITRLPQPLFTTYTVSHVGLRQGRLRKHGAHRVRGHRSP